MKHTELKFALRVFCLGLAILSAGCGQVSDTKAPENLRQRFQRHPDTLSARKGSTPASLAAAGAPIPANTETISETAPKAAKLSSEQIEAQHSPDLKACLGTGDAANGVSVAMGGCFNAELKAQDAQLNAAYRVAMNKRTPNRRSALRTEQRAWIKQRDAQCNEGAVGGTIDLVDVPSCILEETIRRRIALQSMVN